MEPTREQLRILAEAHCTVPIGKDEWSNECVCSVAADKATYIEMGLVMERNRFPNGMILTDKANRLIKEMIGVG